MTTAPTPSLQEVHAIADELERAAAFPAYPAGPYWTAATLLRSLHAENERLRAAADSPTTNQATNYSENYSAAAWQINALTARKVDAICAREPYAVTGVVLSLLDGRACIVNQSAVRWFHGTGDFQALMHGDPVEDERKACAKLCMDKAHKMEREAVDAEKEGDGSTRDDNRATAWVLATCSQEILARKDQP